MAQKIDAFRHKMNVHFAWEDFKEIKAYCHLLFKLHLWKRGDEIFFFASLTSQRLKKLKINATQKI